MDNYYDDWPGRCGSVVSAQSCTSHQAPHCSAGPARAGTSSTLTACSWNYSYFPLHFNPFQSISLELFYVPENVSYKVFYVLDFLMTKSHFCFGMTQHLSSRMTSHSLLYLVWQTSCSTSCPWRPSHRGWVFFIYLQTWPWLWRRPDLPPGKTNLGKKKHEGRNEREEQHDSHRDTTRSDARSDGSFILDTASHYRHSHSVEQNIKLTPNISRLMWVWSIRLLSNFGKTFSPGHRSHYTYSFQIIYFGNSGKSTLSFTDT